MNFKDVCQRQVLTTPAGVGLTAAARVVRQRAFLVAPSATTGGADPAIDCCAGKMGGDDPSAAYAAAMLWYRGYPYSLPNGE